MTTELLPNSSFSTTTVGLQLYWDSVSLGAIKKCPRYYQLTIIQGWEPKKRSVHLEFGIWIHSAREQYYHARANGKGHNEGVEEAVLYVLEATWINGKPWSSDDPNKNRGTLVRSVVWYLDHWENDPMETIVLANGKPAVELSFRMETDFSTMGGEQFFLCGHLDRLVRFNEQTYTGDLKSTKSELGDYYFNTFSPDNQMSLYTTAGKVVYYVPVVGVVVDAVQVLVNGTRFARRPVQRTQAQLDEWWMDIQILLEQAEDYSERNYWPMNDKACFNCDFRGICSKPPGVREQFLAADFNRRVWDPLIARGDI